MTVIRTVLVTQKLSTEALAKLRDACPHVHYHPDEPISEACISEVDALFLSINGFPPGAPVERMTRLRHIQTASAGIDKVLGSSVMQRLRSPVTLANASGVHVLSIPNYVVATLLTLYHRLDNQLRIGKGYGALGREIARILTALGMHVVAANTTGTARTETGYVIPGTGDTFGALPRRYYSTKDPAQVEAFIAECDVLVSSLPDTPQTRHFLDAAKLYDIMKALDNPNLLGIVLDVTDPEPLPNNHPLWTHPKCIITPHSSGDTEGEFDIATDIAIENFARIGRGEPLLNQVHFDRGY